MNAASSSRSLMCGTCPAADSETAFTLARLILEQSV